MVNNPISSKHMLSSTWSFGFRLALWTLCAAASGLSLLVPNVWSSRLVFPKHPTRHWPEEPGPAVPACAALVWPCGVSPITIMKYIFVFSFKLVGF